MNTTGKYSIKPYKCTHCNHVSNEGTNHWGEIYSRCKECSWKRPMESTVKVCLEDMPIGFTKPTPWTICSLKDVIKIID